MEKPGLSAWRLKKNGHTPLWKSQRVIHNCTVFSTAPQTTVPINGFLYRKESKTGVRIAQTPVQTYPKNDPPVESLAVDKSGARIGDGGPYRCPRRHSPASWPDGATACWPRPSWPAVPCAWPRTPAAPRRRWPAPACGRRGLWRCPPRCPRRTR